MQFDEDESEEGPNGPLLPRDDRLWRHPSEVSPVGPAGRTASRPMRSNRPRRMFPVVALTASISMLVTLGVIALVRPVRTEIVESPAPMVAQAPAASAAASIGVATDVSGVAEKLRAVVVKISATGDGTDSEGSGVIFRADGMLLTAYHLVAGMDRIVVRLGDGTIRAATLVGGDDETDIAVLDIDGDGYPVPVMRTRPLQMGEHTVAIGMPPDRPTGQVISVARVSATDREIEAGGRRLLGMIETDDAFSAGCAGGPLVDERGEVTAIATMNLTVDGHDAGYATPIAVATVVADQLASKGKVTRGWLGIEAETLPALTAADLGIPGGAIVRSVAKASPAEKAGMRTGDVVVDLHGTVIETMSDVMRALRDLSPGQVVTVTVVRDGATVDLELVLGARTT